MRSFGQNTICFSLKKIDGKTDQKNYKNARRRMPISDFIAATTTLAFMLSILRMTREQCVEIVNSFDTNDVASALEAHGGNHFFIFSLGIIYIRAKAIKSFPIRLAELLSHHVHHTSQGSQEFLQFLNQVFEENRDNLPRSLWGMCANASPSDLTSFLRNLNSSPLLVFHWLQMAIRERKQIVKEFFQILERIKKDPTGYEDVIRTLIAHKSQLLFHDIIGCIAVTIDTGVVFNLLLIFEINWDFTFAELDLVRKFLKKRPINASFLIGPPGYMSAQCSRYLIGQIMNLPRLLDATGRLTENKLLHPPNVASIHEFVYFTDHHLERIFRNNHILFITILIPGKYSIADVFIFFHNIFLMKHPELFSRMMDALKEYGNKLSEDDIKSLPQVLRKISSDRRDAAHFWLAFMCIERKETIRCLNDHIVLLRAILKRGSAQVINVTPASPATFHEIVRKLRECLPDFVLNLMAHLVMWKTGQTPHAAQLLPVIQNELASGAVMAFLRANSHELPYMLQLMMLSNTIDELWVNMELVMEYAGLRAQQAPPNDANFAIMLEEIFRIFDEVFKKFSIKITDFNERIYALLPKNPNSIFDAFIHDERFEYLTRGVRDGLKVSKLEAQCNVHLATMPPDSTLADAQSDLGIILVDCRICTSHATPEFSCMFPCGHATCLGCFESIKKRAPVACPDCRAIISFCVSIDTLGIRVRQQPAVGQSAAAGGGCASMPPPAKKSKGE